MLFLYLASVVLPKKKESKQEVSESAAEIQAVEAPKDKVIPFTDLSSYVQKLKTPTDQKSAAMLISNKFKEVSYKKKVPTRMSFVVTTNYDKDGEKSTNTSTTLSGYYKGRWCKLQDSQSNSSELNLCTGRITILIDEMIEAMAAGGWGCMNDASEQINTYLIDCLKGGQEYVIDRCKRMPEEDTQGFIRVNIYMLVDETVKTNKGFTPRPHIRAVVNMKAGDDFPVESEHVIYFTRKVEKAVSNT